MCARQQPIDNNNQIQIGQTMDNNNENENKNIVVFIRLQTKKATALIDKWDDWSDRPDSVSFDCISKQNGIVSIWHDGDRTVAASQSLWREACIPRYVSSMPLIWKIVICLPNRLV